MNISGTFRNDDFTTTEINFLVMDRKANRRKGSFLKVFCLKNKFWSRKKFKQKNHSGTWGNKNRQLKIPSNLAIKLSSNLVVAKKLAIFWW